MLNQANPKHTCIHTYIQAYANSEAVNPAALEEWHKLFVRWRRRAHKQGVANANSILGKWKRITPVFSGSRKSTREHQKTLTPREVNQVQELPVFVVPSKEESVDEERIVYKAIVCYGSVSYNDNAYSERGVQIHMLRREVRTLPWCRKLSMT